MGKILLEGIEVMVRIGLLEEELYAPGLVGIPQN